MGTAVITGIFAIAGVLVGTLLEPVKLLIASRARTRQTRSERCASLIVAAHSASHALVQLNAVQRAKRNGGFTPEVEQLNAYISEINTAKDTMRSDTALLRLYGPDKVADQAKLVLDADDAAFKFAEEVDDGPLNMNAPPPKLGAAVAELHALTQEFASVARRYIR
jgi:hypothetical protein